MNRAELAFTPCDPNVLATHTRTLQLAIKGAPLAAVLYEMVCGIAECLGPPRLPAILLVSEDHSHLQFGAAVGMSEDYIRAVQGFPIGPEHPSCASVAFTNNPSILADVTADPRWAPYLDIAKNAGIRSCWSFPIRSANEKPLGTLAVYQNEPGLPDEDTVDLLKFFADSAALIIERGKAAEARDKAESKLRQAVNALTESQAQFSQLADSIPQMVWIADQAGRRLWFNKRWYEYTGTSLGEVAGDGWRKVHHEEHLPRFLREFERSLRSGEPLEDTFPIRRRDGTYRWFLTRAMPLRNLSGEIVRWFGTNTDVTDLRDTQEALRRAEANAASGRMAHAMAHEINNPLAAITNVLFLLAQEAVLSESARGLVAIAQNELDRVNHIAKRTFGLYSSTKDISPTNVCTMLDRLVNTFSQRIGEKGITIERRYDWTGTVDLIEDAVSEAIWNVLDNAIDAVPQHGRIAIRVCKAKQLNGNLRDRVRITIADNGGGIAESLRPVLFQPFASTKERKGAGLGLWVLRSTVARHRGELRIKTSTRRPFNGTTCSIYLPLYAYGRGASHGSGR